MVTPVWLLTVPTCITTAALRSEEHTSELRHLVISYAVFCLKKKSGRLVLYLYLNFFLAFLRSNVQLIVTRVRLLRFFQAWASAPRIPISPSRRFPKHCLEKRPISSSA